MNALRNLLHNLAYRHRDFEKPGVGRIRLCFRRFSWVVKVSVQCEGQAGWTDPLHAVPELIRAIAACRTPDEIRKVLAQWKI